MVLCKFFQQGSCRFGSKCVNEHLDVKQMVKTDVEVAIHGKQWPLSSYGPFRDKPSIPNFIEDQSFEEVRLLCYEAKQKNFFEQFHQQFTKEVLEAGNKMNALLQMTPDVVEVLIKIYDVPTDTSSFGAGKSTNNPNNPFGLGNTNSNPSSIFAKAPTNNTSTSNLFANKNAFGASNQSTSGLFSNATAFAPQQQTSVFAHATQPTNSIFGFGSNTNSTQQNASIFGQQQNPPNIFASSSQQQQSSNGSGIFSQQNQFMQQTQQNSIFRQPLQPSQPQQGLFAQAAQTIQQQQIQPQQGIFAQAAQQSSSSQNLFAPATQQTQNIFGQALQQQQQTNSNIFQQNQPNSAPQQQLSNANIFQHNQPIASSQQIQNIQLPGGAFQQSALQTQNPTGQTNNLPQHASTLYSRIEDLTADEIEAFKADCFLPGKIPFNPPPRELIN